MQLSATQILALGSPGTALLFSFGFLLVWHYGHRKSVDLLYLSVAFIFYALAAVLQILHIPKDIGINALLSGALFLSALVFLTYGVATRYGAYFDSILISIIFVFVLLALAYFYYGYRDVVARIYVLNLSVASIVLISVFRVRHLIRGVLIDRAFFWIYLLFGVSFFPRTFLSINASVYRGLSEFGSSSFWLALQLTLLLFTILMALILLASALLDIIHVLQQERNIDGLTKLYNRRSFEESTERELNSRRNEPVSLVLCDLDRFKSINDNYGHAAGDAVLVEFGEIVRQSVRKNDIAGRFGGEEFIILLPGTKLDEAAIFADRVRKTLESTRFSAPLETQTITASFGVVQRLPHEPFPDLFRRADILLYEAKKQGRNRVMVNTKGVGFERESVTFNESL